MNNISERRGQIFQVATLPFVCTPPEAGQYKLLGTTPPRLENVISNVASTTRARKLLGAFMDHTNPDTWRIHLGTITPDMHDADTVLYGSADPIHRDVVASVRLSLGPLLFDPHHIVQSGRLAVTSAVNERGAVLSVQLKRFNEILKKGWLGDRRDNFLRGFDRIRDDGSQVDQGSYQGGSIVLATINPPEDAQQAASNNWIMSLFATAVTGST